MAVLFLLHPLHYYTLLWLVEATAANQPYKLFSLLRQPASIISVQLSG